MEGDLMRLSCLMPIVLLACTTAEPKIKASASGPDPSGTGANVGVNGHNSIANLNCSDASASLWGGTPGSGVGECFAASSVFTAGGDLGGTATSQQVYQIAGDGGSNSYQGTGYTPIYPAEVCMNAAGSSALSSTLSCNADCPSMLLTDGGANVLCYHGVGTGVFRTSKVIVQMHNKSCPGVIDDARCTLIYSVNDQTDAGGATLNPASPTCAEGAMQFQGAGSNYGTPTITLDASAPPTVYVNVQGTADAGCVGGSIVAGASWASTITE
jgi:hypothetical protein